MTEQTSTSPVLPKSGRNGAPSVSSVIRSLVSTSLREGARRWFSGCTFVVFWIDDQAAVSALAFAFGVKVGCFTQRQVDDPALARGHWAELIRCSRLANLFCCYVGGSAQFLNAQRAAILAIEADLLMLAGRQAQH